MMFLYVLKQGRRTKVGITKNTKDRFLTIKRQTGGGFSVWFCLPIFYAQSIETKLKRRYKSQLDPHKGSGRMEWFKLSFFQRVSLVLELYAIAFATYLILILIAFLTISGVLSWI